MGQCIGVCGAVSLWVSAVTGNWGREELEDWSEGYGGG